VGLTDDHAGHTLRGSLREHVAALARRHDVRADMAERGQLPAHRLDGGEVPEPAAGDVLQEHALHRRESAKFEHLPTVWLDESHATSLLYSARPMPIHLRAEPGQYAEAVLLPGDPLRAKYIAETYLDDVVQRNSERGLLGYTGTFEGKPVSVQGTGMGCPGATIVFEELVQLGCKKLIRVGTCGGLQPHHALGDLIVALTAVPADSTAMHLVGNEPHCPTASWSIIHGAVHAAKAMGQELHVGPIVSSDVFYNPDGGQYERWSKRGVLAVEMEASALFTVAALKGIESGCLLTVSDIVVEGEFTRISDDELRSAVDRMTKIALAVATNA